VTQTLISRDSIRRAPSAVTPRRSQGLIYRKAKPIDGTVLFDTIRMPIVAMEQIDDAEFCARNSCIFNAVNVLNCMADVASTNRLRVLTRLFAIL